MVIETFIKTCSHCNGIGWTSEDGDRSSCPECRGRGSTIDEYKRFCDYVNRRDCEWGCDCRHCEDAEPVLDY